MKTQLSRFSDLLIGIVMSGLPISGVSAQQPAPTCESAPLVLVQRIPLPYVSGRFDHMTRILNQNSLIVTALGNNTVEVVALGARRVVREIPGQSTPQAALYIPELDKLYISNGTGAINTGVLNVFDARTFLPLKTIADIPNADNLRRDAATGRIYVSGAAGIVVIDEKTDQRIPGDIKFDDQQPESFQLETKGPRIFVNLPVQDAVAVVDRRNGSITKWQLPAGLNTNFLMQLDEADNRLFTVTRNPARLVALDTGSGKVVANLPIVVDCDDLWYDAQKKRLYATGGEGFIDVVQQTDPDHYERIARIPSGVGARTSLLMPASPTAPAVLLILVPGTSTSGSEVLMYQVQ